MIGQFLIRYIFVFLYNNKYYKNSDLLKIINTDDYQNKLNTYIDSKTLLIIFIVAIIFIPILYIQYKNYKKYNKLEMLNVFKVIVIGICISLIYNILLIIFFCGYSIPSIPLYVQIISSGIIGPILEEVLFRGIVYNKLKEFNSTKKAMIISTIIFVFFHTRFIDSLYTLLIGYLFTYIYEKTNNLKYPLIMHMSANTIIIILSPIILGQSFVMNIEFSIFLIFGLILIFSISKKDVI